MKNLLFFLRIYHPESIISKKIPNGVCLIKKVGPQKEKPTFIL